MRCVLFLCNECPIPPPCTQSDRVDQKPTSAFSRFQTRALHRIPQLQHDALYKKNGIPEFLSTDAFEFAWTQYQTLLVDKLNLLTQGELGPLHSEATKRFNMGEIAFADH